MGSNSVFLPALYFRTWFRSYLTLKTTTQFPIVSPLTWQPAMKSPLVCFHTEPTIRSTVKYAHIHVRRYTQVMTEWRYFPLIVSYWPKPPPLITNPTDLELKLLKPLLPLSTSVCDGQLCTTHWKFSLYDLIYLWVMRFCGKEWDEKNYI